MAQFTASRRATVAAFIGLLASSDASARQPESDVATLSDTEMEAFTKHCDAFLGNAPQVLHEIVSELLHIDVLPYAPTDSRPFWTLVTMGASAMRMKVPAASDAPARMELMITLPADWMTAGAEGAVSFTDTQWEPGGALKRLARYVHEERTWFGSGHTVQWSFSEGHPLAAYKGFALAPPISLPKASWIHFRPDKESVALLALYPLYDDELKYKLANGFDALLERWEAVDLKDPVVVGRPSSLRR